MSRLKLMVSVVVAALLLAACGGGEPAAEAPADTGGADTETGAGTATGTPDGETEAGGDGTCDDPIKIGVITGLSGAYVSLGEAQRNGAELAVQELGGMAGDCTLEVLVRDGQLTPDVALREAQSLTQSEDIDFLTGCVSAGTTLAMNQVATAAGIPYIGTCQTEQLVRPPNASENTYHIAPLTSQPINAALPWLCDNLGPRALFLMPDYAYGHEQAAAYSRNAEDAGCENVGLAFFPLGTTDFLPYIPQVEGADPDVLVFGGAGRDQVAFMEQASQFGLRENMEIFLNIEDFTFDQEMGFDTIDGTYAMAHFYWTIDDPGAQEFVTAYQEAYGAPPSGYAVFLYNIVNLIAEHAVDDQSPEAFRQAMEGLEFSLAQGPQFIRACDHQSFQPIYIMEGLGTDEAEERGGSAEFGFREILEVVPASEEHAPTCEEMQEEFEPVTPE